MHTPEAKRIGQEFITSLLNSIVSPATIAKIMIMLEDKNVEQEAEYRALLKSTKECKTDEEFLTAVKSVLEKEK